LFAKAIAPIVAVARPASVVLIGRAVDVRATLAAGTGLAPSGWFNA
jgi:hypothetical protein